MQPPMKMKDSNTTAFTTFSQSTKPAVSFSAKLRTLLSCRCKLFPRCSRSCGCQHGCRHLVWPCTGAQPGQGSQEQVQAAAGGSSRG
jgi:hypothetical protein